MPRSASDIPWQPGLTRVPFAAYQSEDLLAQEQQRIFEGPTWNYLCLDVELPEAGSYRSSHIGSTPVVVARDADGTLHGFENRCAHRGALIVLDKAGHTDKGFQCVYHAWSYDLQGSLTGVAFQKGVKGAGGMPASFQRADHGPRKLRITTYCGLVFGTFSDATVDIETHLGAAICARIRRVMHKPVQVIARYTQALPNNWKLYVENVKDSYHASLLHLFFTTFELNRLSQKGGVIVSDCGGHHVSYSMTDRAAATVAHAHPHADADKTRTADSSYRDQGLRADTQRYRLRDPSVLAGFSEYDDGITLQILSVFPGFVLQQIQNCLAVRQVLPRGLTNTDLHWTILGYADDTPAQREVRLKQGNLIGPAGFISMEDGAVGGFVQRGIAGAGGLQGVLEMGGADAVSGEGRATETSVRGFWKAYRQHMGVPA